MINYKRFRLSLPIVLTLAITLATAVVRGGASWSVQDGGEKRTFKTRDFKDMPLAIPEVRNLQSETWYKDLEIEVKNISAKPIYSILAYLQFPDDKVQGNGVSGIVLVFGENKYIEKNRRPARSASGPGRNLCPNDSGAVQEGPQGSAREVPRGI